MKNFECSCVPDPVDLAKRAQLVEQPTTPDGVAAEMASLQAQFYLSWCSPHMQPIQRLISEIARTDLPVLIMGESGTGKEIVAIQIHALSENHELPFVKLSCTAAGSESFQAHLRELESHWYSRNGKSIGTVFFDEISELDTNCQKRVLHLFSEGNGLKATPTSGRIVSCSTGDLETEVHGGRFRNELFYRLNGVCMKLAPLRRRKEDIPDLARFFLRKYARMFRRAEMKLGEETMSRLVDHSWPGNIRELENVIKKIVALENEELALSDLCALPVPPMPASPALIKHSLKAAAKAASQQAERELILQTLERTHWNRKKAAEALLISYKSLLYKLKQIQMPEQKKF